MQKGNTELRLNNDGTVDEIVIVSPLTNECLFHLEQMDDNHYWMRIYGTEQDLVAHIGSHSSLNSDYEWEDADCKHSEMSASISALTRKYGLECVLEEINKISLIRKEKDANI